MDNREMYDFHEDAIRLSEIDLVELGLRWASQDAGQIIAYGRHLLELGGMHELIIYNGISRPMSDSLPASLQRGGSSTRDSLMGSHTHL